MTLLRELKKQGTVRGRRWVIHRDKSNKLTEVEMIYNPKDYTKNTVYGDKALIKILEDVKKNNS